VKVLSAELSRDEQFRARFLREADLAATLDHPNIVTVYTRGETAEGQLWIAMQFVDGSDASPPTSCSARPTNEGFWRTSGLLAHSMTRSI
jgi:eukaryotic-like serine/threonine-protein kinase